MGKKVNVVSLLLLLLLFLGSWLFVVCRLLFVVCCWLVAVDLIDPGMSGCSPFTVAVAS